MNYPREHNAAELAQYGRYGDSMLVHMNPEEVSGIASLVPGGLTRNPDTGLPEAFKLSSFLVPALTAGIGALLPGIGTLGMSALSGGLTAAVTGDLKRGLASGLMSFGIGSALNSAGQAASASLADGGAEIAGQAAGQAGSEAAQSVAHAAAQNAANPPMTMGWDDMQFGERAKTLFGSAGGREAMLGQLSRPGNLLPIAYGGGTLEDLNAQEAWEKQMARVGQDEEEEERKYYGDLQRAYGMAQPFAQPGVSPYRGMMSVNTPEPWRPGMAEGGKTDKPLQDRARINHMLKEIAMDGMAPDKTESGEPDIRYNEKEGRWEVMVGGKPYKSVAREGLWGRRGGMAEGGRTSVTTTTFPQGDWRQYFQGMPGQGAGPVQPGYGGIDPVTIQANLRGQSVAPPPGFVPGFAPEFSYFQNLEEGQAPEVPEFTAPHMSSNQFYAGSPINRFMDRDPSQPYFQNVLPSWEQMMEQDRLWRSRHPFDEDQGRRGYAEGGEVDLQTSLGPMSVAGGGIAPLPSSFNPQQPQQAQEPSEEEVMQVAAALTGQVDENQANQIIEAFVSAYGTEVFQMIRDMILQQGNPGVQTEGMVEGQGGGMDDMVPGTIGGQQPVAVSPGEYIVPADVVSGLGDGSSDAGAQRLDELSGNVRMARTGGKVQPPPIDPNRMLP